MNKLIEYLRRIFKTHTKRGRIQFIFVAYLVYWFIFYGVWSLGNLGKIYEVFRYFSERPSYAKIFLWFPIYYISFLVQSIGNIAAMTFFILPPLAIALPIILINRTIKIKKINLTIYSLLVLLLCILYWFLFAISTIKPNFF